MVSRRNASLKHARYYAKVLLRADRLYEEGAKGIEDGLHLFDDNWKNIELGQKWAVTRIDMDEDAAGLASEYPERGAHCLYLRQKPIERIEWLEAALRVAHSRGFELIEGTLHGKIGLARAEMGDYQQAIEHYSIRLEIARKLNDVEGLGEGFCNLGILYDSLNMLENAQECYEYARELADKIANQKIIEVAIGNLGLVYLKKGQFDAALNCFEKHLRLAQQNGDLWSEGNALTNKGIASLRLQNHKQALQCFQDSILINKKLGDSEGEAKNLSYIGATFAAPGDLDGAASAYQARILIAHNLNDAHGQAIGSWNLGEILIKQKKYKLGLEYLKQCIDFEKAVGDPGWESDSNIVQQIEAMYGHTEE
jgi:tetratricopeptide (TPR) repeat protein